MLKQKVIVKGPASLFYGKEGIVVIENVLYNTILNEGKRRVCKVLVGDIISNWIPYEWLVELDNDAVLT